MRLTCPNCDAQYEVPDEVMPVEGRDVQCSACGCTWFQAHPDHPEAAQLPPMDELDDDFAPEDAEDYADAGDAGHLDPAGDQDDDDAYDDEFDEDDDALEEEFDDPEPEPAPRRVESGVGDILREEAEREARLRAAEVGSLESQPDLGLDSHPGDEAARRALEADARKARMRGENPAPAAQPGSRRGLLPDIDEINSTLGGRKPGQRTDLGPVRAEPDPEPPPRRKGGFMRGFVVALLLAAALALIYANARQIAETVPQADPMLSAFVAMVDQARVWLDAQVRPLLPE